MQPIRNDKLTFTWNTKCSCYQFSLPPRLSCPGVEERLQNPKSICNFCYAFHGRSGQMKNAKELLRRNWKVCHKKGGRLLGDFQQAFREIPEGQEYFRWFGCGDICWESLFIVMWAIAQDFPHIKFWAPTQTVWGTPRVYPRNLVIRQSATCIGEPAPSGGHCTLLPGQKAPRGTFTCPGKCDPCRKCWEPWNPKQRIAFPFHGSAILMAKLNKARRVHNF